MELLKWIHISVELLTVISNKSILIFFSPCWTQTLNLGMKKERSTTVLQPSDSKIKAYSLIGATDIGQYTMLRTKLQSLEVL